MKKWGKFQSAAVAVILVLAVVIAAGCSKKSSEPQAESTSAGAEQIYAYETESAVSTVPGTVTETAAQPEETTQQITAEALPQTVEDTVALFNRSANRIKTEASLVTKNYEKRIVDKEKLVVPKALESTAQSLMDTFMKDDTDPIVYATREEINEEYIVPGQSYVSVLTADAVKSAVCTDKGDTYEIHIKLKSEKNPTAGKGIGAVCDVIEAYEVAEKVSFIEEFTTEYHDCEVKVTVDKVSGRVIHAVYITPLVLNVKVNLFGTHTAAVGLTFEKDYTINY